jgi:hypothetical protein
VCASAEKRNRRHSFDLCRLDKGSGEASRFAAAQIGLTEKTGKAEEKPEIHAAGDTVHGTTPFPTHFFDLVRCRNSTPRKTRCQENLYISSKKL